MSATQYCTVPGKVDGIIGLDPLTMQCRTCGATSANDTGRGIAMFIILSGWGFHTCEPDSGRKCRECLAEAHRNCENPRRHE